jgi:hypothetical protein
MGTAVRGRRTDSRFLTGLLARFGMTKVILQTRFEMTSILRLIGGTTTGNGEEASDRGGVHYGGAGTIAEEI